MNNIFGYLCFVAVIGAIAAIVGGIRIIQNALIEKDWVEVGFGIALFLWVPLPILWVMMVLPDLLGRKP